MKSCRDIFSVFLIIALLTGCTPVTTQDATIVPSTSSPEIQAPEPTATVANTKTPVPVPTNTPVPTPGAPLGSTDTHEILYLTTWDLGANLMAYNLSTGSSTEALQSGFEQFPVLSPDGAKVLIEIPIAGQRTQVVYDLQNHTYAAVSIFPGEILSWSPDGNYAVINDNTNGAQIMDMRDGHVVLSIWKDRPDLYSSLISFASEGSLLLSGMSQTPLTILSVKILHDQNGEINGLADKTDKLATPILGNRSVITSLQVSPDGQRIALVGETPLPNTSPTGDDADIYVIGMDGKGLVNLTKGQATLNQRILCSQPIWSPDSQKLAFFTCEITPDGYTLGAYTLQIVSVDGQETIAIDSSAYPSMNPLLSWSADSQRISYLTSWQIAIASMDQSPIVVLDLGNATTTFAAFRPPLSLDAQPVNCARTYTHLKVGIQAVVAPGSPNRVRSEPNKGGNVIESIPAGTQMTVLEGPVCADGLVFWKIQSDKIPGGTGWTAEGDFNEHWLEPLN